MRRRRSICILGKLKQMSVYTTIDIINLIGMNDIGYELREEYESIERKIEDIKEQNMDKHINACSKMGEVRYLKYLHENGCKWDKWTCYEAARNGHIECLRYLHENGCEWNKWTCEKAAENGHLECLRYLHENGCEWDESTCADAAMNGHIECLRYVHENGCKWDEWTCVYMQRKEDI